MLSESEPFERAARFAGLLERSPPGAVDELQGALAAARVGRGAPEVVSFAMWWARSDPAAALAWSAEDPQGDAWPVVREVFRVWAHSEPEQAFARLGEVPSDRQEAALEGLVAGWHDAGHPGLVDAVRGVPDLVSQQKLAEKLAEQVVARRGAEGAIRWLQEIPPSGFRTMLARRVASAAAAQDDAAAIAEWARAFVAAGDERPSGLPRRIATRWVLRDPDAAWAWLESLPAGKDRDDAVMETFRDWSRLQTAPALLWIREAEVEPWLEPAFALYARRLSHRRPEEAMEILSRFTNEEERERFTLIALRNWVAKDPEAARAWLASAQLSDSARERAEAQLGAGPPQPGSGQGGPLRTGS